MSRVVGGMSSGGGSGGNGAGGAGGRSGLVLAAEVAGFAAVAGLLHTSYKVLKAYLEARRMQKVLEDVPYADYASANTFAGFVPDFTDNRKRVHDWFDEASAGKPVCKMIGLRLEPTHVWLIVRDPQCIKHFLKDSFSKYTKPDPEKDIFWFLIRKWLGHGIFTMMHGDAADDGGAEWLTQQKIASSVFSRANFTDNMGEVFKGNSHRLAELLRGPASRGEKVDLQELIFGFTMDSSMKIFTGEDINTMGGDKCAFAGAFDHSHRSFTEYARTAIGTLTMLNLLPWPFGGFGGLGWMLHGYFNPYYREFSKALSTITSEGERMVASARLDPDLSKRKDLLALFLKASEKEAFSNKYLSGMILSFFMAGRDTTASLLTWMFFVLSTNPEVQAKLLAEIDAKLPSTSEPTFKSLAASSMPYLNGVIYETLRMYPPAPLDNKVAAVDDVLPDGTKVPKGTTLYFAPFAMGRDPAVWPEPLEFRPDRWIPFKAPAPHEFPVFQAGPRICLGMDMAIFEAKVLTVKLLQRFEFSLLAGEKEKIHYSNGVTMALCNSKAQDSSNLWVLPRLRA